MTEGRLLDVFLVAGEDSGDQLGAKLMAALRARLDGRVSFRGVGGGAMGAEGLASLFPMEDVTAVGLGTVFAKLPTILRRIRETAAAVAANPPDLLILIDSPDFNHRVARRVRRLAPAVPVVKYVSPTVWVWRPGRARAMRPYVDHILALFPFEPEVHERLGGPACSYVGHPLLERLPELRPSTEEKAAREHGRPLVLVLPGSRRMEVARLAPSFGAAVEHVARMRTDAEFVLPTVPGRLPAVTAAVERWPVKPRIVTTDAEKYAAFRTARAALAASGTVTLELALAGVPMVAGYKVSFVEGLVIRALAHVDTPILVNLVLRENVVPALLQEQCNGPALGAALLPLLEDGPERRKQLAAFARLDALFDTGGEAPSERAARIALEAMEKKAGGAFPIKNSE